jgi:hypothetical protein
MGLLQCRYTGRMAVDSRCHSNDERRYIVHFDELLSAFLELEARLL